MSRILPLFPLNIVVFPGEKLNLHIFEPKYKELITECAKTNLTFGIPPFLKEGVSMIGTEMEILTIDKEYGGGELDIKTKGTGIFRIEEFYQQLPGKEYAGGKITGVENIDDEDIIIKNRITELLLQLYETLGLAKLYTDLPQDYKIFDIAHHVGLTTDQEFEILVAESESTRQEIVLEHLLKVVPVVVETEKLKERVKLNGHFKNLIPPNF
ncbi:LON peptidase substrate-binding domain-containing protein [Adhaeribacter sp. BT258]|uniref:LON peptidase substrate-binding domain-containing protein n=1 Tax=Adhaeribacter terrigena TaxID=2793070 RepID=A0ABS1C0A2_9BACT|nr:LON peptidase substrate-binding domain-containing protein [Adhaeribacter terrigena]MBK0402834.1 LON peptidase substrate-binding domain-containing protein [Adhaeribacter terrigena]